MLSMVRTPAYALSGHHASIGGDVWNDVGKAQLLLHPPATPTLDGLGVLFHRAHDFLPRSTAALVFVEGH
jgi:hypothetical protein